MYVNPNFKTKKAFREHVAAGKSVELYQPGLGEPRESRAVRSYNLA